MASSVLVFTSMCHAPCPWHFLYFFPLPHGHGSLRPTFGASWRTVLTAASSPPTRGGWRLGAGGVATAERVAPANADTGSSDGPLRISGVRGRAGARRAIGASPSSLITGRRRHISLTIS